MAATNVSAGDDGRPAHTRTIKWLKLGGLAVVVIAGVMLYINYGDLLSLEALAARESQLRQLGGDHPVLILAAAFLTYVVVTGLSIPGATVLTLLYGWFFGFWRGVVLVSFASTAGATLAFLLARFLLRDIVQRRFGDRLRVFNDALAREGAYYLFTLRLVLVVPFFVINVVMGLTPMRTRTFWWVSQVGMLPATCIYVYAGSSVPNLTTLAERGAGSILSPQLIAALVLLGVFPLATRKIMQALRPRSFAAVNSRSQD